MLSPPDWNYTYKFCVRNEVSTQCLLTHYMPWFGHNCTMHIAHMLYFVLRNLSPFVLFMFRHQRRFNRRTTVSHGKLNKSAETQHYCVRVDSHSRIHSPLKPEKVHNWIFSEYQVNERETRALCFAKSVMLSQNLSHTLSTTMIKSSVAAPISSMQYSILSPWIWFLKIETISDSAFLVRTVNADLACANILFRVDWIRYASQTDKWNARNLSATFSMAVPSAIIQFVQY